MELEIIKLGEISLVARTVRTNNHDEFNESTAKIMPLWLKAYEDGFCQANKVSYGIYHNYASDYQGDYDISVAVEEGVVGEKVKIQAGQYLKFTFRGEMPKAVIDGWQYIWQYFSESVKDKRKYSTDFEKYDPEFQGVEIFISII
jgi:predicted transcriptional regulator YdeE